MNKSYTYITLVVSNLISKLNQAAYMQVISREKKKKKSRNHSITSQVQNKNS